MVRRGNLAVFEDSSISETGRVMPTIHACTCMSHACTPSLVGVVSLLSEITLLSKTAKFPSMVIKKFNQSELAQKIYASRD